MRPLGRLAYTDHQTAINAKITDILQRILSEESIQLTRQQTGLEYDTESFDVCLVGSTAGSTSSGMMLDVAMKTLIFDPLGMQDTGFHLAPNNAARLPACYTKNVVTREVALSSDAGVWCSISPTVMLSGGAGLFS